MATSELVWLITGTSSGLGRLLALAALERGDKVIATARARSFSQLDDLKEKGVAVLELDVTASIETLHQVAKEAIAIYGRVDVLVNNAGYISVGALEEMTPEETLQQFQTNVFGALNVSRAFLPYMRERKTGTIIWMGSLGGWRGLAYVGLYCSTKWALRALSYSLHDEIEPLGLRSICIDFGYFRTSFLTEDHRAPPVARIPDYHGTGSNVEGALQAINGNQPGDPVKGVKVVVDLVHGTGVAEGKTFPVALSLGSDSYETAKGESEKHLQRLEEWKDVSFSTDF